MHFHVPSHIFMTNDIIKWRQMNKDRTKGLDIMDKTCTMLEHQGRGPGGTLVVSKHVQKGGGTSLPNDYVLSRRKWRVTAKMGSKLGTSTDRLDLVRIPQLFRCCLKQKRLYFPAKSLGNLHSEKGIASLPEMYRNDLYPLYVWNTSKCDDKSVIKFGGARERPASRKCCWRSVIRRHSADLNVDNVTSIMYLFDVHWTYYSFIGKRLCFLAHCSHGNALDHTRKSPSKRFALRELIVQAYFHQAVIMKLSVSVRLTTGSISSSFSMIDSKVVFGQETSLLDSLPSRERYCNLLMIHVPENVWGLK